jgi:2,3-bisphosphoglycerate-independent phosphoglycerate mutase
MKAILIVGDGMGDRPIKALDWKTPLQVAEKPVLDRLACTGICGMMDPISPGIPPGSDTSHLSLFGYDPYKVYKGRGVFEALGAGLRVEKNDVSVRCNLATVDDDMIVLDRRAGRINTGGKEFETVLNDYRLESFPDVKIIFKHTIEHRGVMILRPNLNSNSRFSWRVSDSDPHRVNLPIRSVEPLNDTPEAIKTSKLMNKLTQKFHLILESHPHNIKRKSMNLLPANALLFRGASVLPELKSITKLYGVRALVIAGGAQYKGVGIAVGMDSIEVEGATGTTETNTILKAKAVINNLQHYDYIFVHVKGTDSASHDGDFRKKISMIEKIDTLLGYILKNAENNKLIIAVTADHTTPVEVRDHTGDPVPLLISGPGVRVDKVKHFSEIDCAQGSLGRIRGLDLTPILMNLIGKTKKFGV